MTSPILPNYMDDVNNVGIPYLNVECASPRTTVHVRHSRSHNPLHILSSLQLKRKTERNNAILTQQARKRRHASFTQALLFPLALERSSANQRSCRARLTLVRLNREYFFKNEIKAEGR